MILKPNRTNRYPLRPGGVHSRAPGVVMVVPGACSRALAQEVCHVHRNHFTTI